MKKNILNIIIIFVCISCYSQSVKVQDSKNKRLLDLDNAKYPDTCFSASNVYKSVKIIPLQTNESCLIGEIDKIQVVDHQILIMDGRIANSLYVFDREGRFIRKIGGVGQGPGEYISIDDFAIDRENKTVYIKDGRLPRIHKYDLLTGKFIQSISLQRNVLQINSDRALIHHFVNSGGVLYASAIFYNHAPNNFLLFTIDESSGMGKNNFLNVMEYSRGFSNVYGNNIPERQFFFRKNGDVIFFQPFMSHIIEITKNGVFSLFEIKGKNILTSEEAKKLYDLYSTKNLGKDRDPMEQFKIKKYFRILEFIEDRERIFMKMPFGMQIHSLVINKGTNEVYVYCFRNDVLYRKTAGSRSFYFGCTDSNGVYYHTGSNGIPVLKDYYKAGALSPDVIGLEKIKDLVDDDNPILLYYEFKE